MTRNDPFQTTEDALDYLASLEVEAEALEDGEDEEQVDRGQELYILTTTIRRLKPIAIVNKNTITIASLIQNVELHQGLG